MFSPLADDDDPPPIHVGAKSDVLAGGMPAATAGMGEVPAPPSGLPDSSSAPAMIAIGVVSPVPAIRVVYNQGPRPGRVGRRAA